MTEFLSRKVEGPFWNEFPGVQRVVALPPWRGRPSWAKKRRIPTFQVHSEFGANTEVPIALDNFRTEGAMPCPATPDVHGTPDTA